MRVRPPALTLIALTGLLGGCLFDERPACFDDVPCPEPLVCVARACVPASTDGAVDASPDGPVERSDDGLPDAVVDAAPTPDLAVDMAAPCSAPVAERCNGRDDDCDGTLDEQVEGCDIPDNCQWRHRGSHSYLFCDGAVEQSTARQLCVDRLGLHMAVTETCAEMRWLFATGNLVPTPVDWSDGGRGRAWWLGLHLTVPDTRFSLAFLDRIGAPDVECWMEGEPDTPIDPGAILGESCVDVLYNRERGSFGWNDELCVLNRENPVNAVCETRCDPDVDRDGDGLDDCVDCDDGDPQVTGPEDGSPSCPAAPAEGLPP